MEKVISKIEVLLIRPSPSNHEICEPDAVF